MNDRGLDISSFSLKPDVLADLIGRVERREFSSTVAKDILDILAEEETLSIGEAAKRCGATEGRLSGDALLAIVKKVIGSQPEVVATIREGKDKKGAKMKFLQGLVMKETRGQADPKEVFASFEKLLR